MECTQECIDRTERGKRLLAEYDAQWPAACHKCNATGWLYYTDSVPYGSGNVSMPGSDVCECVERGCPRCGNDLSQWFSIDQFNDWIDAGEDPCPNCGWNHGNNPGDTRPEIDECWCWMLDEPTR